MKKLYLFISFILLVFCTSSAEEFADEISLPVIDGWVINAADNSYPIQIISPSEEAELLIFKSEMPEDKTIIDNLSFKRAVDQVIKDIILTLPEGQVETNTGYFEKDHLKFAIDFISTDSVTSQQINHRLAGYIYSHPDGYQYLFTLWGKSVNSASTILLDEIAYMQDNFRYYGEMNEEVFSHQFSKTYMAVGVAMVLLLMILLYARKKRNIEAKFAEDSSFWRCSCGRQNHNQNEHCKRCGQPKKKLTVSV